MTTKTKGKTRGEILQQLAHLKVAATKFNGGRTTKTYGACFFLTS